MIFICLDLFICSNFLVPTEICFSNKSILSFMLCDSIIFLKSTARKSVVFCGCASSSSFTFTRPAMASAIVLEGDFLYSFILLLTLAVSLAFLFLESDAVAVSSWTSRGLPAINDIRFGFLFSHIHRI